MNYWLIAGSWIAASLIAAWAWSRMFARDEREWPLSRQAEASEGIWPSSDVETFFAALDGEERRFAAEVIADIVMVEQFVAEEEEA